jgi:hypothetical protein
MASLNAIFFCFMHVLQLLYCGARWILLANYCYYFVPMQIRMHPSRNICNLQA